MAGTSLSRSTYLNTGEGNYCNIETSLSRTVVVQGVGRGFDEFEGGSQKILVLTLGILMSFPLLIKGSGLFFRTSYDHKPSYYTSNLLTICQGI